MAGTGVGEGRGGGPQVVLVGSKADGDVRRAGDPRRSWGLAAATLAGTATAFGAGPPLEAQAVGESPAAAAPRPVTVARWRAWRRAHAQEPPVERFVREALRRQRLQPERFARALSRARQAGWLPRVTLGVARGEAVDWWWQQRLQDEPVRRRTADQELRFEVALRFDLGRLVFAPEETALHGREATARLQRRLLVERVVDLYYERRRLLMEVELQGLAEPGRLGRIEAIEAHLEALTGGAVRFGSSLHPPGSGDRGR